MNFEERSNSKKLEYGGSGDPEKFFGDFEYKAHNLDWDDKKKLSGLTIALKDKAKDALNAVANETDYNKVKEHIIKKCDKPEWYYRDLFSKRTKQDNEDWATFASNIRYLAKKGYSNMKITAEQMEDLVVSRIRANLTEGLNITISLMGAKTVDDIVSAMDACVGSSKGESSISVKQEADVNYVHTSRYKPRLEYGPGGSSKMNYHRFDSNRESSKVKQFAEIICHKCGGAGHKAVVCPSRRVVRFENRAKQFEFKKRPSERERSHSDVTAKNADVFQDEVEEWTEDDDEHTEFNHVDLIEVIDANFTSTSNKSTLMRIDGDFKFPNTKETISIKLLVDSGASHSFVKLHCLPNDLRKEVGSYLNQQKEIADPNFELKQFVLNGATTSEKLNMVRARLDFYIKGKKYNHPFLISDAIRETAILGRDFLKAHNTVIDHSNDSITINKLEEEKTNQVKLVEDVVLKARHECVLKGITSMDTGKCVVFESVSNLHEYVLFANTVNTIDEEKAVYLKLANISNEEITLKAGTVVGALNLLDEQEQDLIEETNANVIQVETEEHLNSIRERINKMKFDSNMNCKQVNQLKQLIYKYRNIFQWSEFDVGKTDIIEHEIDTGTKSPIRQKQYKLPVSAQNEIKKQIESMLKNGIIETSNSPWCSPILIVKKKSEDGSERYRLCIDFRKVNSHTVKDAYPIPNMEETRDAVGGATMFSSLDMSSGYWQIPLRSEDRQKTAFAALNGLFQFRVMPFGLCNAPSTFQRLMNALLSGLTWEQCLVYLDDIIVFANNFETHIQRLENVFKRFEASKLKLNPDKCKFCMEELPFLGYILSNKGLKPDENKLKSIKAFSKPSNKTELLRFLNTIGFYRRFIPNFSHKASCLFKLTESNQKFVWNSETQVAFDSLKETLMKAPILAYPDHSKEFELYTDASKVALGAVLMQKDSKGISKPIAFASRHLTKTERNYSVTEKELLAIVWATKHFNHYVFDRKTTIFTDHQPLATMSRPSNPSSRIASLFFKIPSNYVIEYLPGRENLIADLLSRLPRASTSEVNNADLNEVVDWQREQLLDDDVKQLIGGVKKDFVDFNWFGLKHAHIWNRVRGKLALVDGRLVLKDHKRNLIVVPDHMKDKVIKWNHDEPCNGHLGFDKTYYEIRQKFFWPNLLGTVCEFCKSCEICQKMKPSNNKPIAPMKPIVVRSVWELAHLDCAGPLVTTQRGNKYFLIVVDHCSKFSVTRAVSNCTAKTVMQFLEEAFFFIYGIPIKLITDQGRNFESELFKQFCNNYHIDKVRTTSYHPQSNGLVERTIRSIKQILRTLVDDDHMNWDVLLPKATFIYNNSLHSSTGVSPHSLIYGKDACKLSDKILSVPVDRNNDVDEMISRNKEIASENSKKAIKYQKKQYDKQIHAKFTYKVNDLILLQSGVQRVGHSKSFETKYKGPFVVIKVLDELNYKLSHLDKDKHFVVHYNRMKPYHLRLEDLQEKNSSKNKEFSTNDDLYDLDMEIEEVINVQKRNKRINNVEQVPTTSNAGTTTTTDQELGSKMSSEQRQNHPLYRIGFDNLHNINKWYVEDIKCALIERGIEATAKKCVLKSKLEEVLRTEERTRSDAEKEKEKEKDKGDEIEEEEEEEEEQYNEAETTFRHA